MKRTITTVVMSTIFVIISLASGPVKIELWPDGAPTKNGLENVEEQCETVSEKVLSKISKAELWIYPSSRPNGMCIVSSPGGGYYKLAIEKEGTAMAAWMNKLGITYAVLKYRMPNGHYEIPLEDGRRAMEIMRSKASEYGFRPDRVGIMGGSAGGHFAAMLSTMYGEIKYRPDFQILLYPVITMGEFNHSRSLQELLGKNPSQKLSEKYSIENRVTEKTPPAFIVLASDDKIVNPENSLIYARALLNHKVSVAMFMYPHGDHGFGFRDSMPYKREWTAEFETWLRNLY